LPRPSFRAFVWRSTMPCSGGG